MDYLLHLLGIKLFVRRTPEHFVNHYPCLCTFCLTVEGWWVFLATNLGEEWKQKCYVNQSVNVGVPVALLPSMLCLLCLFYQSSVPYDGFTRLSRLSCTLKPAHHRAHLHWNFCTTVQGTKFAVQCLAGPYFPVLPCSWTGNSLENGLCFCNCFPFCYCIPCPVSGHWMQPQQFIWIVFLKVLLFVPLCCCSSTTMHWSGCGTFAVPSISVELKVPYPATLPL